MRGSLLALVMSTVAVLTSTAAQARVCNNNICVGDRLASEDPKKNFCTITSIDQVTEGGLFNSRTYIRATEKCSDGSSDRPYLGGYGTYYLTTGCVPAVHSPAPALKVCVGGEFSYQGQVAKVIGIDANIVRATKANDSGDSAVIVKLADGTRSAISFNALGLATGCTLGLCAGDQVLLSFLKAEREADHDSDDNCNRDDEVDRLFALHSHRHCGKDGLTLASVDVIYMDSTFGVRRIGGDNRPELHVFKPTFFAITKGCLSGLCVGQKVTTPLKREAVIAGLTKWSTDDDVKNGTGTYVIQYTDTNKYGEGWLKSDLTVVK